MEAFTLLIPQVTGMILCFIYRVLNISAERSRIIIASDVEIRYFLN